MGESGCMPLLWQDSNCNIQYLFLTATMDRNMEVVQPELNWMFSHHPVKTTSHFHTGKYLKAFSTLTLDISFTSHRHDGCPIQSAVCPNKRHYNKKKKLPFPCEICLSNPPKAMDNPLYLHRTITSLVMNMINTKTMNYLRKPCLQLELQKLSLKTYLY